MAHTDLQPAPLPARLGALFIDLAVPAMLSFGAGVASWVAVNLVWSALIGGGGLALIDPSRAYTLLAPSVFGSTTIGALGPVFLWALLELWMLHEHGQTWGLREQGLRVARDGGTERRVVVRA